MRSRFLLQSFALGGALILGGCTGTLSMTMNEPGGSPPPGRQAPQTQSPPRRGGTSFQSSAIQIRNNATVRLQAGRYNGDLVVTGNSVRIFGAGRDATALAGNVTINGNNVVMADLTITGNVIIRANNADLRSADIRGRVSSSGNNNRW